MLVSQVRIATVLCTATKVIFGIKLFSTFCWKIQLSCTKAKSKTKKKQRERIRL